MAGEIESITEKAAGVTAEPLTGNVAFELQYSEVTDGGMYLILVLSEDGVPTADNILYVNQGTAGDGKVAFDNVYPKEIPETASFVYMSGTDMAYSKLAKVNPKVAAVTGVHHHGIRTASPDVCAHGHSDGYVGHQRSQLR